LNDNLSRDSSTVLVWYVKKHPDGAIHFWTNILDQGRHTPKKFDWSSSVYGNVEEDVPHEKPIPKGKVVHTTTYQDANLFQDFLVIGWSMTGMLNQALIHWFSKR
jgi:hypothetical protein